MTLADCVERGKGCLSTARAKVVPNACRALFLYYGSPIEAFGDDEAVDVLKG